MHEVSYKNQKPNTEKLLSFGFVQDGGAYMYRTGLLDGQMELTVRVENETVLTAVADCGSGGEYVLHLVPEAVGAFVGRVRTEYGAVLEEIFAACFESDVFKSRQTKQLIAYIRETYGDALEFLWPRTPDNAVVRRQDNAKWYAAFLTVSARKLGLDSDESIEIIDLRMKPETVETVVDGKKYFPGYHMNKKHWITVCLDETVETGEICKRIDESYALAKKG